MTDKIITEKSGDIARIIFNQPEKRNAVSLEMWEAVEAALDAFEVDPEVRILILSGAGGKAFVSGADISKFESERASEEGVARYNATTKRVYDKLEAFPKPTIAQINGFCIGGGVALSLSCDMRICGKGSQFAVPAAKLGLGYGFPGINRLVNVVGPSFAKEIFFTARRFDAEESRVMGLVNRVVEDEDVAQVAEDTAKMIAANAPMTVASVKFIVGETLKDESKRDEEECARRVKACFDSQDYVEGRRAFLEKRKPQFVGA
ncbi:enoyl-CoA hydratase [Thalassobacter stenotrophicus]|jgi:enoyl-CoA hydratase/carnithine racemase|uniref:Methylmalonyl-CoA decarboxylase n=2 Tax=Thalassobacter stenotrophicus TaxID=266809 RepID=A0A0P1F1A4_9RHOB|nr:MULTISPECIES: enoyl-CoA hydratase [Thalassobacter]KGK78992.1 enoyl-CoA hydratase [Thalassobacter stenotrophicus]KGL02891.1 enoyl-CoA hydratase [Thalassobacter sp. 16PALIMAR09]PVZ48103.1 enoyl-CoA hydratase [Thalassobacter stenotrophicus]UYP69314.1 enoyl-CoA hydratase [Thalassobacter stenotrophicus]CUH60977.1 Methylmalonyl-CoA decarboxylase [Thalassobacter stenotrophicus]